MHRIAMSMAVIGWVFLSTACAPKTHSYAVIPGTPYDFLRWPDHQQTPFPEVLQAYNGYTGRDSIELRPLMQLQIENAYYEPGASRRGLSGFLGTEKALYDVVEGGLKLAKVEPMKDRPAADKPVQDLIASTQIHFEHYRFYYQVLFAKRIEARGSVLLGAHSKSELDALTARMGDPDAVCGVGSDHCAVFPEACSVAIYMQVTANGKREDVLWGSTLAGLAEGAKSVSVKRLYRGKWLPVRMEQSDTTARGMVLLPGDKVVFH